MFSWCGTILSTNKCGEYEGWYYDFNHDERYDN